MYIDPKQSAKLSVLLMLAEANIRAELDDEALEYIDQAQKLLREIVQASKEVNE